MPLLPWKKKSAPPQADACPNGMCEKPAPNGASPALETAVFAQGWFWGPQAEFDRVPGVVASSVGYTGGINPRPTYESVCAGDGHTEALKLEFDPSVISYEELMRIFYKKASAYSSGEQYKSAVWAQNAEQAEIAKKLGVQAGKSKIEVLEASAWHDAEAYHQKYLNKR